MTDRDFRDLGPHTHGVWYRAKVVDSGGNAEYSTDVFVSQAEFNEALGRAVRDPQKIYFCEELRITKPGCAYCEGLNENEPIRSYMV
jgi:hypothetical protein